MANDAGNPPLPSALEMVLRRLSIIDGHALGCGCPACTRTGNAHRDLKPELGELEREHAA